MEELTSIARGEVFPTQVGVILWSVSLTFIIFSIPHASGGDPLQRF